MRQARNLIGRITTASLVGMGAFSVVVAMMDLFFLDAAALPILRERDELTFLLVGVLCLALGLERVTSFEVLERGLADLSASTRSLAPARVLDGHEAIYAVAGEMVGRARRAVRASSFRDRHSPAPGPYLGALARKMRLARKDGRPIEYRLVYGYGDDAAAAEADRHHCDFFRSKRVDGDFVSRFVPSPIGLDILVVDEAELLIALPAIVVDPELRRAVHFTNVPSLIDDVRSWYDDYLWANANPNRPTT